MPAMTPLALYLLVVLLLSTAAFFAGRLGRPHGAFSQKRILQAYAGFLALASGFLIINLLGWQFSGASPHSETAPYRLEHTGFYTAEGLPLIFQAYDTGHAARLSVLREGENLTLTPSAQEHEGQELHWRLAALARAFPLRIDGSCVNLPSANWLKSGDEVIIEDPVHGIYATIRWTADLDGGSERWLFNQGVLVGGRRTPDFAAAVPIEERRLQEGLRLSLMVQHSLPHILRNLEKSTGEPEVSGWRRFLRRGGSGQATLSPGVALSAVRRRYRALYPLYAGVLFVRRSMGDLASPMGVFLDPVVLASDRVLHGTGTGERALDIKEVVQNPVPGELPGGTRVRYGFGASGAATLILSGRRTNVLGLGLVVDLDLENPPSWPLPDRPTEQFMIFSQEILLPVKGFQIDSGLDREPFYAKARYLAGRGAFELNDGREFVGRSEKLGERPLLRANERFHLGGVEHGVVLQFLHQESPIPWPGPLSIIALLVAAALFTYEIEREPTSRPRLDLAWTLLWGFVVTLLVVRVILAYRVAVLPPNDATALEVHNVFQKSFRVAFLGLSLIPAGLVAVRWLAKGPRSARRLLWRAQDFGAWLVATPPALWTSNRLEAIHTRFDRLTIRRPWLRWVQATISTLPPVLVTVSFALFFWILLGFFTRRDEILGIRVNIAAHLLIILGIALAAAWATRLSRGKRAIFALLWLVLPALGVIVLARDVGFAIQLLSLLLVGILLTVWNVQRLRNTTLVALILAILLLLLAPASLHWLLRVPWVDHWVMKLSDPAQSHLYYRLVVPGVDQEVLARPAEEDAYSMTYFLRNSQQHWQMLLYASQGAHRPQGYGGAPLSRIGMTYPTSMSDCVLATYVISEHGAIASLLLLLVYAGIGAILVFAAAYLPDRNSHRALGLIAVGGYFSLTGFYMVSANLGLLLFTGQNLPLLSLVSASDLAAGAVLLGIVALLIRSQLSNEQTAPFRFHPWVRRVAVGYLGILVLGWVVVAVRLGHIANDSSLRRDFTLTDDEYRRFAANLPEPGKSKPLQLEGPEGEDLRIKAGEALSWSEKQFVRAFNLQSDHYDPQAGFYYLEPSEAGPRLRINRTYLNLSSPFESRSSWSGVINAQGAELPTLSLLGEGVTLRPARTTKARGETVPLSHLDALPSTEVSGSVVLALTPRVKLCDFSYEGAKFNIFPYQSNPEAHFEVHVDGEPLNGKRPLSGGEVIRITGEAGGRKGKPGHRFSYSLMYLGAQRPILSFSTWRNGKVRRVVTEGSLARLADDLGHALDEAQARKDAALPQQVVLTINEALHRRIERELAVWLTKIYRSDDPSYRRRGISLTVLDAFSGRILAVPSLPLSNARTETLPAGTMEVAARLLRNDNLRNHVIGSTIKPLLFSAVASGYWPAGVDLGGLAVEHGNDREPVDDHSVHPHHVIAGVRLDSTWDCLQPDEGLIDARAFLINSRNYFAAVVGLLGTALDPHDWSRILRPGVEGVRHTAVTYQGVHYVADLSQALPEHTSFTFDDVGPPSPKARELGESLLFRQMSALFSVEPDLEAGDNPLYRDYLHRTTTSFYPGLQGAKLEQVQGIETALPDLQSLRPGSFHSTSRDLMSLIRGGGTAGRWNNIRLSEAAARLATGLGVVAHLTEGGENSGTKQLPAPLSDNRWRLAHLVEPLRQVAQVGTAKELQSFAADAERKGYRLLVKTGTLEELPPPTGSARKRFENELLLFVFGKWMGENFVPGQTVAGVLSLEDSKPLSNHEWVRTQVADPVFRIILEALEAQEQSELALGKK